MTTNDSMNQRWVLRRRPAGEPSADDFALEEVPVPEIGAGELLVAARYLSVDPYMRGRMRDVRSYVPPVELGAVMSGGVVGEVVASRHDGFATGDVVEGLLGWQTHAVSDGRGLRKVDPEVAPISTALGVLGMPGLTGWFGLTEIGRPSAGETVVVSAAAGAVGSVVGQVARLLGCRAVGIAGGPEKARHVVEELGFDACIDYRAEDVAAGLRRTCPDGVDVYFDNVGGATLDAVLRRVNVRARIVICGAISEYNLTEPELAPRPTMPLLVNRARMEGFIVFDFAPRYREGLERLGAWVRGGELRYREDVIDGIERMPEAFLRLFRGANLGKQLVRIPPR